MLVRIRMGRYHGWGNLMDSGEDIRLDLKEGIIVVNRSSHYVK